MANVARLLHCPVKVLMTFLSYGYWPCCCFPLPPEEKEAPNEPCCTVDAVDAVGSVAVGTVECTVPHELRQSKSP